MWCSLCRRLVPFGGISLLELETDNEIQYRVSIVYAVIIAFFSLIIGGGFLVYGNKLMGQVKATTKQLGSNSQNIRKVKYILSHLVIIYRHS